MQHEDQETKMGKEKEAASPTGEKGNRASSRVVQEDGTLDGADTASNNNNNCVATDEYTNSSDYSKLSRSERKRLREKKRRDKENSCHSDLKALLLKIDPQATSARGEAPEQTNRADLMARAVEVMRDLHEENVRLQKRLKESSSSSQSDDNDRVTIAVPYLIPVGIGSPHAPPPQQQQSHVPPSSPLHLGGHPYRSPVMMPPPRQQLLHPSFGGSYPPPPPPPR